jgi:hypothetical protein
MKDALATGHGSLRLMQRARDLDKTMTELWDESIECEVKYHGYDEARVSPEYDLVLLKESGQIVTVIPETYNVTIDGDDFEKYMDSALEGEE